MDKGDIVDETSSKKTPHTPVCCGCQCGGELTTSHIKDLLVYVVKMKL